MDITWAADLTSVVPVVGIDTNNNLTVHGVPVLLIRGSNFDYNSWRQVGYTEVEADAKLQQAVNNGYNCTFAKFGQTQAGYFAAPYTNTTEDMIQWQKFGIYWMGQANYDNIAFVAPIFGNPPANVPSDMIPIINRSKNQPNVMMWSVLNEIGLDVWAGEVGGIPTINTRFRACCDVVAQTDPQHPLVSSEVVSSQTAIDNFDTYVNSRELRVPMMEVGSNHQSDGSTYGTFNRIYNWCNLMNTRVLAHPEGLGWIPSCSTTIHAELVGSPSSPQITQTFEELNRYWWLQVALNCRAFEVLWGPNQRNYQLAAQLSANSQIAFVSDGADTRTLTMEGVLTDGVTVQRETPITLNGTTPVLSTNTYNLLKWFTNSVSDASRTISVQQGVGGTVLGTIPAGQIRGVYATKDLGLPDGYLTDWNNSWTILGRIKSVQNLVLAPGNWAKITTTPAFVGDNFNGDRGYTSGIYAAKKLIGAITYVIAFNVDETHPNSTTWIDNAVNGATITVGTGTTCVRLFEGGSPTFTGGVITDDFTAFQAHVYQVT